MRDIAYAATVGVVNDIDQTCLALLKPLIHLKTTSSILSVTTFHSMLTTTTSFDGTSFSGPDGGN